MKCKITAIAMSAAMIFMASCQKDLNAVATLQDTKGEKTCFTVNVSSNDQTKTAYSSSNGADTADKAINSIQVLVFNDSGKIECYDQKSGVTSITLSCTKGTKDVYVVANGTSNLSTIKTKSELLAHQVLLTENTPTSIVMFGGSPGVEITDKATVNISVKRLVCRVSIDKITRNFTASVLNSLDMVIQKIYLINVAGHNNYSMNLSSETTWFNDECLEFPIEDDIKGLIYDEPRDTITSKETCYTKTHTFYSMPTRNNTSDKPLRLVIQAYVNGQQTYYPVTLPSLSENQSYLLKNLTIKRIGSNDPNIPVTFEDIEYDIISVDDWNTTNTVNEFSI